MADTTMSGDPVPDEGDALLPDGWVEAFLPQLETDDEPNVLRGLD
ncbi:hypothetical protein [Kutzneria buriramensis]|uniref:Uncharacterized protein n=1 Tax=Kutzneria buriramensis TaxID=1045776 RepID=A0A3E0H7I5_9PSEU|nr:hypothetical protein [Kutzneria buriramensis]REH39399.1 hypothetical protein BCF44_113254 [Kutzneria buriramensis]